MAADRIHNKFLALVDKGWCGQFVHKKATTSVKITYRPSNAYFINIQANQQNIWFFFGILQADSMLPTSLLPLPLAHNKKKMFSIS